MSEKRERKRTIHSNYVALAQKVAENYFLSTGNMRLSLENTHTHTSR